MSRITKNLIAILIALLVILAFYGFNKKGETENMSEETTYYYNKETDSTITLTDEWTYTDEKGEMINFSGRWKVNKIEKVNSETSVNAVVVWLTEWIDSGLPIDQIQKTYSASYVDDKEKVTDPPQKTEVIVESERIMIDNQEF